MKATGIVRRMDDLGRVVIPKEIRRTRNIMEGDPLEIFVENDSIILRKYSTLDTVLQQSEAMLQSLEWILKIDSAICNTDTVVACKGTHAKRILGERLSDEMIKLIRKNEVFYCTGSSSNLFPVRNAELMTDIVFPILQGKDIVGAIFTIRKSSEKQPDHEVESYFRFIANSLNHLLNDALA